MRQLKVFEEQEFRLEADVKASSEVLARDTDHRPTIGILSPGRVLIVPKLQVGLLVLEDEVKDVAVGFERCCEKLSD